MTTSIRSGATKLGLQVSWRYSFVAPGASLAPMRGCVCLGVGNGLSAGVLDTSGGGTGADSTAQLVIMRPELVYEHLLGPVLDRVERGEDVQGKEFSPILLTHVYPDFDTVAATLMAQALIEDGELPPWANALAAYAAEVSQGRYRPHAALARAGKEANVANLDAALLSPVHAAFLAVQCLALEEDRGHEWALTTGLRLVQSVAEAVAEERAAALAGSSFHAFQPGADAWRRTPEHAQLVAMLEEEPERWKSDLRDAESVEDLVLPDIDGRTTPVRSLFLNRPPRSRLNKYWARSQGFQYFVCPYGSPTAEPDPVYPRVFLSLSPPAHDARYKPNLLGLGFALEQAEKEHRQEEGGDDRLPIPRYADGSCDNDDPWYDGRNHAYTIVDSPRQGTRLPYARICEIARSKFWEPPIEAVRITVVRSSRSPLPPFPTGQPATERLEGRELITLREQKVHLGALEHWLAEVLEAEPSRIRVDARHVHAFWPMDSVISRLTLRFGASMPLGDQTVYFAKGLVWAVPREGTVADIEPKQVAFASIARLDLQLEDYASRTRKASRVQPPPGRARRALAFGGRALGIGKRSVKLRREFLDFRVNELNAVASAGPPWDPAALALAENLRLTERAERTREDLNELAGIEGQLNQKVFEGLVALVGAAGVAQTVAAVFAMTAEQRAPPFRSVFWGLTLIPVLALLILIARRDGGSPP